MDTARPGAACVPDRSPQAQGEGEAGAGAGAQLLATYGEDVDLPRDADDTGYRHGDRRLWLAADRGAAFVITSDGVERWPPAKEPIGCA